MIIQSVNPTKLLDELTANGVVWTNGINDLQYDNKGIALTNIANLTVEFENGTDMSLVQQIIDAHDPSPLPEPPTLEEQLAKVKEENQLLKIRDAGMQEDINFIYETLGG